MATSGGMKGRSPDGDGLFPRGLARGCTTRCSGTRGRPLSDRKSRSNVPVKAWANVRSWPVAACRDDESVIANRICATEMLALRRSTVGDRDTRRYVKNCAVPIVCESQDERCSRRALVQNANAFLEMRLLKCGSSRLPARSRGCLGSPQPHPLARQNLKREFRSWREPHPSQNNDADLIMAAFW